MAFLRNAPSFANLPWLNTFGSYGTARRFPKSVGEENAVIERNTIITTDIKSIPIKFLLKNMAFLRNAPSSSNLLCYT